MKESKTMKRVYKKPFMSIVVADASGMICASVGVIPSASNSTDNNSTFWSWDQIHNGGTFFLGDETTIAPSKKGSFTMDED